MLTPLGLRLRHNRLYNQVIRLVCLAPYIAHLKIRAQNRLSDNEEIGPQNENWKGLPVLCALKTSISAFPDDDGLCGICTEALKNSSNLVKIVLETSGPI